MQAFEQLGFFYLGKRYDLASRTRRDELVLYDARDLVTHAVCVGMTGSGKTGLGITVIEEAAIDGIPVLAIDPKGDLANLALTFPSLSVDDFASWANPLDAASAGMDVGGFAAQQAERWRKGLAEWGQDADRVARLRAAAAVTVFTPGSRAGAPLALLATLAAPANEDEEDAASRVASTADSLLALAGTVDAEAHSRERTLLATILSRAPAATGTADLAWLVQQIQRPSFERVGVLDLETFFPARERQELALRFNSVLASPGFDVWLEGAPLDPGALLYDPDGKPRVAIVSIAHLGEAERMVVVSLLLNAVVAWTRRQRGTTSLRALVYMDEVFGYLPPVANPPSKTPLLTLLKQARAYGVGVMLATQNPVDLDYKALSNTGTWFLGKLQTERDKARVLDGLEGIAGGLDRPALDSTLSALSSRVFLMHNVHEREPIVFETRWTLSYLRGPLGRDELKRLQSPTGSGDLRETPRRETVQGPEPARTPPIELPKPVVPAGIQEVFVPAAGTTHYVPTLYAAAKVHYTDVRRGIDVVADVSAVTDFATGAVPVQWDRAIDAPVPPEQLTTTPPAEATFEHPPAAALEAKRYAGWGKDFVEWVVRSRPLQLFSARALKLTSTPGEGEREFRLRAQLAAREARDAQVDQLRAKYAARIERASDKIRRAQESVGREEQQVSQQRLQTAVSVGATIFGALLGRKTISTSTLGRATTAARGVSRSMKEAEDVAKAQERVAAAQQELAALEQELERQAAAISSSTDPDVETVEIKAKRGSVDVRLVALAWVPRRL